MVPLTRFTKMHGLGNDFVVIDAISQSIDLTTEQIRLLAHRHFGIGCDQLLLAEPSAIADFRYRIFNADGGEVEQCGNGARCFARFVIDQGLTTQRTINVETARGLIQLHVRDDGQITVDMGRPDFQPSALPFSAAMAQREYQLEVDNQTLTIGAVSMGNPHAVTAVNKIDDAPLTELGPLISSHPRFPQGVNAGFMQIEDRQHIRLRVYERGVGETLACGSGACAAVAIGRQWNCLDETVAVALPGGTLTIHWSGGDQPLSMTGPATSVFEGQIRL